MAFFLTGMQDQEKVLEKIMALLRTEFAGESTGHDWFHIERVYKNARQICLAENADLFVTGLAALLHDIADHKFVENADWVAEERIRGMLGEQGVPAGTIDRVVHIVRHCSFKGGFNAPMELHEGLIVQDADRLDAIGAIGIARTFAFGGKFGNVIYDPGIRPATFDSPEEYRNKRTHTINHFYEKLLLLRDGMNTETGRKMAEERHRFMESFLQQFYREWEGGS